MSDPIDDGGPAFPQQHVQDGGGRWVEIAVYGTQATGMSLRQHYAGLAMQALIHEGAGYNSLPGQINPTCDTAVDWADSLLRALKAKP